VTKKPATSLKTKNSILQEFLDNRPAIIAVYDAQAHQLKEDIWTFLNSIQRNEHYNPKISFSIRYHTADDLPNLLWVKLDKKIKTSKGTLSRTHILSGLKNGSYQLRIFSPFMGEDRERMVQFEMQARPIREALIMVRTMTRCAYRLLEQGNDNPYRWLEDITDVSVSQAPARQF